MPYQDKNVCQITYFLVTNKMAESKKSQVDACKFEADFKNILENTEAANARWKMNQHDANHPTSIGLDDLFTELHNTLSALVRYKGGGCDAASRKDGSVSHNLGRCEAATEHSDVKGLNARNPLCQWVDGSTETVWACPGGVNSTDDHCINGSVITRPLPAGQPPTKNGTCRSEPYIVLTPLICTYLSRRITRLAMILPRVW